MMKLTLNGRLKIARKKPRAWSRKQSGAKLPNSRNCTPNTPKLYARIKPKIMTTENVHTQPVPANSINPFAELADAAERKARFDESKNCVAAIRYGQPDRIANIEQQLQSALRRIAALERGVQ